MPCIPVVSPQSFLGHHVSVHLRHISNTHQACPWLEKTKTKNKLTSIPHRSTPGGPRRHSARTGTLAQFLHHRTQCTHPDVHGDHSHSDTQRGLSIYGRSTETGILAAQSNSCHTTNPITFPTVRDRVG